VPIYQPHSSKLLGRGDRERGAADSDHSPNLLRAKPHSRGNRVHGK
jgi:hypothetical protein